MAEQPAAPDPERLLALLWRQPPPVRRGPAPTRSLDEVVDAAIALADRTDLASVTMRALAQQVGLSTMALYGYVPGRAELVDLMVDRLYLALPRPALDELPWADRIRTVADLNRSLFAEHRWLGDTSSARPPLGPGASAKYEYELSAFDGLGLDDVTVDDCLAYLLTFVHGAARAATAVRAAQLETAWTDQEWWDRHAPLLERVFDAAAYPRAVRIGSAAGHARGSAYDPDQAYEFGLARVLAGIAALLADPTPLSTKPRTLD